MTTHRDDQGRPRAGASANPLDMASASSATSHPLAGERPKRTTKTVLPSRRRLLGSGLALVGIGALLLNQSQADHQEAAGPRAIRPPGALPESQFNDACIRCGLCVSACPFDTLHLAGLAGPVAPGTPFFEARATPCEMCADLPCVRACPSGALQQGLERVEDARMGVAWLSAPETCYSYIGAAACNSCWQACPLQGQAIVMVQGITPLGGYFTPTVKQGVCTGCGLCEQACIAAQPAITVQAAHAGLPVAQVSAAKHATSLAPLR